MHKTMTMKEIIEYARNKKIFINVVIVKALQQRKN